MSNTPDPRCATCRHWGAQTAACDEFQDWQADKLRHKRCERVIPRWKIEGSIPRVERAYIEDHLGFRRDETAEARYDKLMKEAFADHPAYVQDGSEYVAELITGPTFGCTLHEAKE